jgi:hypothetical protein
MKPLFYLFLFLSLLAAGAEPGLLLYSSFNKFSTVPDFSVVQVKTGGIASELQLRMYKGPKGKDNGVELNNREFISYTGTGIINPGHGTISFWVKPVNWKMHDGGKYYHKLITVRRKNKLLLRLLREGSSNMLSLHYAGGKVYAMPKWEPGEWHKIDFTWNSNSLKLYIDGKTPKNDSSQVKIFRETPNFPNLAGTVLYLNDNMTWLVDPEWKTAYDEFKVYDRVLSPSEILADYEKYYPSKKVTEKPFAKIPAVLPICHQIPIAAKPREERLAAVTVTRKKDWLILDYTVPNSGAYCSLTRRDGELWRNDAVEFHALGKDGKARQFIVNPAGALYDSLGGNASWNSRARVSARREKKQWHAHLEIPLEDLQAGNTLQANFGVSSPSSKGYPYTWSPLLADTTGFSDRRSFGTLQLDGPETGLIGLTGFGSLTTGELAVEYLKVPGTMAECIIKTADGDLSKTFRKNLPAGQAELSFSVKDSSGKTIYRFSRDFVVNPPLLMTVMGNCYAGTIDCRLDFSASGMKQADGLITVSKDGRCFIRKEFHSDKGDCEISLPVPKDLPEASTYTVEAKVGKYSISKPFRYPDMTPYRQRVAVNHDVPRPWHAVKVSGNTVSVLDRTYHFEAGPLPVQTVSRGQKLLAVQPAWILNGKPLQWSAVRFGRNYGDYVEIFADGSFDGGKARSAGELWFDGMYKFRITLTPSGPLKLNSMHLTWSVFRDAARYLLVPGFVPWKSDTVKRTWTLSGTKAKGCTMIWLTGYVNGFAWSCDSNANWIIDQNRHNISIVRNERQADVRVSILAKSAVLKKPASYTMVFQATPPKHPDRSYREICSGARWQPKSDYVAVGGHSWNGPVTDEHIPGVVGMVPADMAKFRKSMQELHAKGFKTKMYGMPTHMGKPDEAYDWLFKGCATLPGFPWEARDPVTKERYLIEPCCGHTPVSDLHAWNLDRLYREVPELDGCYFDIMSNFTCKNPLHGCAGTDAFGHSYQTLNIFHRRAHSLRILKIHQKYNRNFGVHAHSAYYPFIHDLGDYWMPGEELFSAIAANPEWGYLETLSPEAYQSAWNSEIRGMAIEACMQLTRIPRILKLPKQKIAAMRSDEYFIHALAPSILYDYSSSAFGADPLNSPLFKLVTLRKDVKMASARFHGYWTDPATIGSAPPIRVSWYSWSGNAPHTRMLCPVNTGREPVRTGLKFDWKKIGIAAPSVMTDLWTGKFFTEQELENYQLKGHNFMMLVPGKVEVKKAVAPARKKVRTKAAKGKTVR